MTQEAIDSCLYAFLQTSYHFEAQEKRLFNLSWQEIYLLQLLRRRETWQISQLGKKLELKKYQISRLVSRLEALGLVRRLEPWGDRRNVHVAIQEEGHKRLRDIETYHRQLFNSCEYRGGPGIQNLAELNHAIHQFATMVGINLEE
jgi:DNA-binding MarR family transcriptional regulator